MSLVCPECGGLSFNVIDSVECGPSQFADESTVQRAICTDCDSHFICSYLESRSFNPDRDDRVSHKAFIVEQELWESIAITFQTPSSKVATPRRIAIAMRVLKECQENSAGKAIRYARIPVLNQNSENISQNSGIASWFNKLLRHLSIGR